MTIKTCVTCKKKMTAETTTCVFCGGRLKKKKSLFGLLMSCVLVAGCVFASYSVFQALNESKSAVGNTVASLGESDITALEEEVTAQVNENSLEPEALEQTDEVEEVAQAGYEDSQDGEDFNNANPYQDDEVDPKVEERRDYWSKIYRDKYPIPQAGQSMVLRLKSGRSVQGRFMGVVSSVVKLDIEGDIKSISKTKLSKKSRLRMFCTDYVEYFVAKKLKEEGLCE